MINNSKGYAPYLNKDGGLDLGHTNVSRNPNEVSNLTKNKT